MEEVKVNIEQRGYFESRIFNELIYNYNELLLSELMKNYLLLSAKGTSRFKDLPDVPYYVHILNGLYPACLLLEEHLIKEYDNLEENKEIEKYIKCFIIGYTLHDINKLCNIYDLRDAVDNNLKIVCNELNLNKFFPEWDNYIEEIKFIILKTEERTKNYATTLNVKNRNFLIELVEYSQFADKMASQKVDDAHTFFNKINKIPFKTDKKLSDFWNISYVCVDKNIHTLLSQKLITVVKLYLRDEKEYKLLFHLKDGVVYFGNPLDSQDFDNINKRFENPLQSEIDFIATTKIDSQKVDFGFLDFLPLNENIIKEIVIKNISKIIYFKKELIEEKKEFFDTIIDYYELPLKIVQRKDEVYFVALHKEWNELNDNDKKIILNIGLSKILFLKGKDEWKKEMEIFQKKDSDIAKKLSSNDINTIFTNDDRTNKTLLSILYVCENEKEDPDMLYSLLVSKVLDKFNIDKSSSSSSPYDYRDFITTYLNGNFIKRLDSFDHILNEPTIKKNMCIVCGGKGEIIVKESKVFGFSARGFSNKCLNKLNNNLSHLCPLCATESLLRIAKFPKFIKSNLCIYIDVGDYFINMDKKALAETLQKLFVKKILINQQSKQLELTIQKISFNFDYNTIIYYNMGRDVESNYWTLNNLLNLIKYTGFKIYTTNIITPHTYHNEMFIIEECMPFIKQCGWDKVRIDEIPDILEEHRILRSLAGNQIVSLLLDYASDKKSIFSYFYKLDDSNKNKIKAMMYEFLLKHKEVFEMNIMEQIVDCALKIQWGFGSTSQETWMFRDSIEILKSNIKEGNDKNITIQQIAGMLYKTLKSELSNTEQEKLTAFAESIWNLYDIQWKKQIPYQNRLNNWIYQFGFLYSQKSLEEMRKATVSKIIKELNPKDEKEFAEKLKEYKKAKNQDISKNTLEAHIKLFNELKGKY
ncbi:MAG: hypothetical protein O8C64_05875 [Candidatus Methanoperedens sp.]|nr:hypothetical protein [Candidatus Methanoperedens sp.]MCZ7406187.1 hypothetical protein [Candidatus Methanoperedens sp.]